MTLFKYTAIDDQGQERRGSIDAINEDVAIAALQRRSLVISSIKSTEEKDLLTGDIKFFERITNKEIVILSRQITTLFEAQVSALRAFSLLSSETENPALRKRLTKIVSDLESGSTISDALAKHPKVFSHFYVSMVKTGEETGKLDSSFTFLADYLDRTYEVGAKARNALIYPAFVIATFFGVMILMLTTVIPRLSDILLETGQAMPVYTRIVIAAGSFMSKYIFLILIAFIVGGVFLFRYAQTEKGKRYLAKARLNIPYVGDLYRKLYMSRIADSLSTTLSSGIQLVRGVEISSEVVDDPVYAQILKNAAKEIQGGRSASDVLVEYPQFPHIFIAMMKVGEETGDLGNILETMAKFYRREVNNSVDTLVSLIEPLMIVMLGAGVGFLLASVLVPIYNLSSGL